MTQYVYQPLDERNNEIRLITLLPASDRDSEVICDLHIVRLTKEDVPKYEALSYTWGSTESPVRLRVSSVKDHSIDITRNLAEALPYLRNPTSPRTLWIDAIAIDQKNLEERGQQVQRMAGIFSLAERVVVWLGKDDASSKKVMEISEYLETKVEIDPDGPHTIRSLTDEPDDSHWSDIRVQLPYDIATWQAIVAFLRRPWFHRLWIWQEIRIAESSAIMICGADIMRWTRLKEFLSCIAYKQSRIPPQIGGVEAATQTVSDVILLARTGQMSLSKLLVNMRNAQCVDARDRVYGILGLTFPDGVPIELRPDYRKKVVEVYMDLMLYWTQNKKRLDLLSLCKYEGTTTDWPTWIPRLTNLKKGSYFQLNAAGRSTCEVRLLENGVLRATGLRLGQITMVDRCDARGNVQSIIRVIQRWMDHVDIASIHIDGRCMIEAFCLALCGDALLDYCLQPPHVFTDLKSALAAFRSIEQDKGNKKIRHHEYADFIKYMSGMWRGQAFFKTTSNHIGIVPVGAREGDEICVLLGCSAPVVIRSETSGRYKVIGRCNVYGLRSNEAFLGPIPKGYRQVINHDAEAKQSFWVFQNEETGKTQAEDPRLDTELPSGWRRVTDVQGHFWEDFYHDSAPDQKTRLDPRLTRSELLKRGVPLEDIEFT
jgi:hypothetical protein